MTKKSLKVLKSKITLRPFLRPRKRSKYKGLRGIKYISLKVLIKYIIRIWGITN